MSIDLDFRPEHPFRLKSITHEAIRRGEEHFAREFRRAFERAHPSAMGGNYLPSQQDGEVEVARIQLDSTTADVGCVWVRQSGGGLIYRFVDEYQGETLNTPSSVRVTKPLTLGALARFIARVWGLRETLDFNFEDGFEGRLAFFNATSADYPELDAALCELAEDWYDEDHGRE